MFGSPGDLLRGGLALALLWSVLLVESGATKPSLKTGIHGRLVAAYAPDGHLGRSFLTTIDLADLVIRTSDQIVNDIAGRGDDVFVALGAPAVIARYSAGQFVDVPGLDQVFLSSPSMSADRRNLAFVRDPRKPGFGDEIWVWSLSTNVGRLVQALPEDRFAYAAAWREDGTLLVSVAARDGGSPELLVLEGPRADRIGIEEPLFHWLGGARIIEVSFDDAGEQAHLHDLSRGSRTPLPSGWRPLCLSEDRKSVLLGKTKHDSATGVTITHTTLGVAPVESPFEIQAIGGVRGALMTCVWQS